MNIRLNGKETAVMAENVAALVEELRLNPRELAIERNSEIVPRSTYAATHLCEGDVIELVTFVGGG